MSQYPFQGYSGQETYIHHSDELGADYDVQPLILEDSPKSYFASHDDGNGFSGQLFDDLPPQAPNPHHMLNLQSTAQNGLPSENDPRFTPGQEYPQEFRSIEGFSPSVQRPNLSHSPPSQHSHHVLPAGILSNNGYAGFMDSHPQDVCHGGGNGPCFQSSQRNGSRPSFARRYQRTTSSGQKRHRDMSEDEMSDYTDKDPEGQQQQCNLCRKTSACESCTMKRWKEIDLGDKQSQMKLLKTWAPLEFFLLLALKKRGGLHCEEDVQMKFVKYCAGEMLDEVSSSNNSSSETRAFAELIVPENQPELSVYDMHVVISRLCTENPVWERPLTHLALLALLSPKRTNPIRIEKLDSHPSWPEKVDKDTGTLPQKKKRPKSKDTMEVDKSKRPDKSQLIEVEICRCLLEGRDETLDAMTCKAYYIGRGINTNYVVGDECRWRDAFKNLKVKGQKDGKTAEKKDPRAMKVQKALQNATFMYSLLEELVKHEKELTFDDIYEMCRFYCFIP